MNVYNLLWCEVYFIIIINSISGKFELKHLVTENNIKNGQH